MRNLDLIHPVRLRIVHCFAGERVLSATQLLESLNDIPKATLYRHLAALLDAGALEIVDERRVRGALERRYRIRNEKVAVSLETAAEMTAEDHKQAFRAAMAVLLAEFQRYVERPGAAPLADQVGYRQFTLWLSPDELKAFVQEVTASLMARAEYAAGSDRRPYLVSPVIFPSGEPAPASD